MTITENSVVDLALMQLSEWQRRQYDGLNEFRRWVGNFHFWRGQERSARWHLRNSPDVYWSPWAVDWEDFAVYARERAHEALTEARHVRSQSRRLM